MLKKTVLSLFCCGLLAGTLGAFPAAAASKKKKKAKSEQPAPAPKKTSEYEKLFKEKHETADGMIRLHKVKGKLYFEFPVALLGRDMLLGSTVSEISDNGDAVIGSKPTDPLWIQFTRTGDKVQVRKLVRDNVTDAASPNIARSLANNNIGAIIKSYDIAAWSPDSCAVVFNATDLFLSDNKALTPFDPYGENLYYGRVTRSASYQSDKSFLGEIRAFEDNVVIRSHLSYTYTLKAGSKEIASDVPFTAVMTRSLVLLPETPYEPRFVDSRMSVFPGRFFSASGSSRPSCSATPTAGASSRRTRRPTAAGSSSGPRNRSSSTSTPISPRAGASPFSRPSSSGTSRSNASDSNRPSRPVSFRRTTRSSTPTTSNIRASAMRPSASPTLWGPRGSIRAAARSSTPRSTCSTTLSSW